MNDNAPVFTQPNYSACIIENNVPGKSVFTVSALDSDWNQNARISYFLEDSQVSDSPSHSAQRLNRNSPTCPVFGALEMAGLPKARFILN